MITLQQQYTLVSTKAFDASNTLHVRNAFKYRKIQKEKKKGIEIYCSVSKTNFPKPQATRRSDQQALLSYNLQLHNFIRQTKAVINDRGGNRSTRHFDDTFCFASLSDLSTQNEMLLFVCAWRQKGPK